MEQTGFGLAAPDRIANRSLPRLGNSHQLKNLTDLSTALQPTESCRANSMCFALEGAELGFPPNWNKDPKTGTQAPLALASCWTIAMSTSSETSNTYGNQIGIWSL